MEIMEKNGIAFSESDLAEIELIKKRYPSEKSALMPVLWLAQKRFGWLSGDVIDYVAELLHLPVSHIQGVASFYTMYFKKPMGKYHIQVCTNVSCMLREGEMIFEHVSQRLGLGHNECSDDGLFSLEEVECMGACGGAPMIAVNEDYYENVDIRKVDEIISNLK